ncbi:uncharacterized protein C8Q71DRAFT_748879 [Rhodofomes roseus]|uniref:Mmc1 C-terminal domain-containing protein n=1 Tax=Rhodofomes roseus TaxID=34475 RepID=A0ABQ8KLV2_9APHY|nr:uncharacterized protein C8Q71DRAFT_748879 [Rhodofomes roseus]KAH9839298.1 hypothetical protein C8Q71DRAFT_748879 [Rhodofomes roseus]
MPAVFTTCSSCSLRIARAHACGTLRTGWKSPGHGSVKRCTSSQRAASSAAATALKPKSAANDAGHRVMTVLHKARKLVPHVLPRKVHAPSEMSSLEFWERTLGRTYDDLCPTLESKQADRIRIAVFGCDEFSGARDLVAAILEEPFASEVQRKAVHSRWGAQSGSKGPVVIEYSTDSNGDSALQLRSAWLLQFSAPVKLLEFDSSSSKSAGSLPSSEILLTADIPVIVCNPASTPLHTVLSAASEAALPLTHPNAVLVLTSTSGDERLVERLRAAFGHDLTILFVDPARALQGLRALSSSPSSPSAVQRYQDDFAGSNVPKLTQAISQTIPQLGSPAKAIEVVHAETARAVTQDALSACNAELGRAQDEVNVVCDGISSLRARMEEIRVRTPREVLGGTEGGNEVQRAVDQSRKDVKTVLDRLTWWKLLWKVDDVGDTVTDAVNRAWCRDLEYRLVFHAGRLAFLQRSFVDSASAFTASFKSSSAFHSPVLQNQLSQISLSPTFPMDTAAFLQPLYTRRQQLRYPTGRLQSTAQRVLIGMSGSVFGGASVAWAGWAGQLGIIDMAMQAETVIGVGMLGAVAGVRWAVGRFERAKRKWLQDYDRVGEGLERDLRATLDQTVNERVLVVSDKACDGLEQAVSKRTDEIAELKEAVDVLEDELSRTYQ